MKLPSFLPFLPTLTLASPLLTTRDVSTITLAISGISNSITDLNTTLNNLGPFNALTTLPTLLSIEDKTYRLSTALSTAISAVQSSSQLSNPDSGTVATSLVLLTPNIKSLLTNLVSHKPSFDSAILDVGSVSPQVHYDLTTQKSLSDEFSTALVDKLDPVYARLAPLVAGQISSAFEEAIDTFAQAGGWFHLPAVKGLGKFEEEIRQFFDV